MSISTNTLEHPSEFSTPVSEPCEVSRGMLLSALNDNAAATLDVVLRAIVGGLIAAMVAMVLPTAPGLAFYAALCAALPVIYVANLADVRGFRDAVMCVVPGALVWAALWFDASSVALVGLSLFTHVMVAFFAGFARVSGSLRDLGLWPVFFGLMSVTLVAFVDGFLL